MGLSMANFISSNKTELLFISTTFIHSDTYAISNGNFSLKIIALSSNFHMYMVLRKFVDII